MSVPITTRLEEGTVEALDRAVRAGAAPTRAAVVARAVEEWLGRHSEEAIAESYRTAYANPDLDHDGLVGRIGAYSASVIADEPER